MTTEEDSFLGERDERDECERQLDAIIAAYHRAVEAGECIDQKDFIVKHPEFEKDLSDFFKDSGKLSVLHRRVID
jgi:hypothetical protein